MRQNLKHVHRIVKTAADGRRVEYFYAWRGGPRIVAEPGSPAFHLAYTEAWKNRGAPKDAKGATLAALVALYKASAEFTGLGEKTRRDYARCLDRIRQEFGDMPRPVLQDPETRGEFKAWRDTMAHKPRTADMHWTVLARVLSWAKDRGKLSVNVCERGGRLYESDRRELIWTEEVLQRFFEVAPFHIAQVVMFGLWTGQRQADLLKLAWTNFDGRVLRLRQGKKQRGKPARHVTIPCGGPLLSLIQTLKDNRRHAVMLLNSDGEPWTSDGFRSSFGKICDKVGVGELHFHDLRGTAVTRLALAGCSEAEIASITGHSMNEVRSILEANYLGARADLAEAAVVKLCERFGN